MQRNELRSHRWTLPTTLPFLAVAAAALALPSPDLASQPDPARKSFTLLLAAEAVEGGFVNLDDLVTIGANAEGMDDGRGVEASSESLTAGVRVRFEDLLHSMIHESAGHASTAVARHVAIGYDPTLATRSHISQEAAFTRLMNDRALDLGLFDTDFQDTPGRERTTSARDMARWRAIGMEYPVFREIAASQGT